MQTKDAKYSPEEEALLRKRAAFQEKIEKVMGKMKWDTHTPESMQEKYAELALMRELKEKDASHLADDAHFAALMPHGALVRRKGTAGSESFVWRVYDAAVLLWPAKQQAVRLWVPDESATSLIWQCVFDLKDWEELPTYYRSPLANFLQDLGARHTYGKECL